MSCQLTQEEIDACRDSFVHFDKDGSGTIDKYELAKVMIVQWCRESGNIFFISSRSLGS